MSLGRGPGSVPLGLTLIEAQKYARRAEQLAVLKTFAEGELLRRLPFRNLVGGSLSFPAETKLPRVGFRAVNEGYRQSYGVINSDSEFVHLFGGDLDVDRSIVDLQGPEARAAQTEMKVRSMRLTLEAAIINGDDTFDPRAFNGLSKRLVPGEDQTIDNGGSTLNLLALEALTDSVIGYGGDKVLIASKAARRQISTASRQAGGDLYEVIDGRHYFEGIEILLVEEDAEGNAVLGYDEPGDTTSIYCCVLGDAAVCGLQGPFEGRYGISVRDFGEVHDAPVFRTRVDWYVGFAVCNRKAAARLFNVAPMPLVLP
ncbi:hypothetical protein KBZ20_12025 [Vulcanococcus limneticus Candia 3F8]|nr:hypothetical protein [Vulcanococcus limneticus Candia 3F8]MCP9898074.1 hypothetical protein [Vulcanococcus limneticus Candia 3B3]